MKQETIYITQNTTFEKTITVLGPTNTAVDLTGNTVFFKLSKYFDSTTVITGTAAIITPAAGTVKISLTSTETNNLPHGTMQYSVFRTVSDVSSLVLQGQAIVIPTV
jgi:hypothetical protein